MTMKKERKISRKQGVSHIQNINMLLVNCSDKEYIFNALFDDIKLFM